MYVSVRHELQIDRAGSRAFMAVGPSVIDLSFRHHFAVKMNQQLRYGASFEARLRCFGAVPLRCH
jgi:hypothetical protein